MVDHRIPLCFGSDFPVENPDPLEGFFASLTGSHRIEPTQALKAYTETAQWAAFQEGRRGKLLPGYSADITVLDRDILTGSPDTSEVERLLTVVNGKITHGGKR